MSIPGYATTEGTQRYRDKMSGLVQRDHFKNRNQLWYSSIGLGTYLGNHDDQTDKKYQESIGRAVELGCNVIDTAINYRFQRSERAIGKAMDELITKGIIQRDELIISTKGGFIPGDSEPPRNFIGYFDENFMKKGIANREDLVMGCHCMTPSYIQNQIDTSLNNLGLESIDIYYLHNPETQLEEVDVNEFYQKIKSVFELLEKNVSSGKIQFYGVATWNGFRVSPDSPEHLELNTLVRIAEEIIGKDHHFRVIQLPLNLAMPEALIEPTQTINGKFIPVLQASIDLNIGVFASASMLQGQLSRNLPAHLTNFFDGLSKDSQRAIHFTRSTPGIITALVGMSHIQHVEENMDTAKIPLINESKFMSLFAG